MQMWRVTYEQARTPDGVMVPAHGRHRMSEQVKLPSLITENDARIRIPNMIDLPPRFRILNIERLRELP